MKNKKSKTLLKKFIGTTLISFYFIFGVFKSQNFNDLRISKQPVLFSLQAEDNIKNVIINSIKSAKSSIFLRMYLINDKDIEEVLIKKSQENIPVHIICHSLSKKSLLYQNAQKNSNIHIETKQILKSRKLMHIKAIAIDNELIFIGSANLTKPSLMLDKNLITGFYNNDLCKSIIDNIPCTVIQNNQKIFLKINPMQSKENLTQIKELILNAKKTIKIGMYVFTLPQLMDALQIAQHKGVSVEIIIDSGHAYLTKQIIEKKNFKLPIFVKTSPYCLHHKFAWIDDQILIVGSANWTYHGFFHNDEYILYLYNLTEEQQQKMNLIWKELNAHKRPLIQHQKEQRVYSFLKWAEHFFQKIA